MSTLSAVTWRAIAHHKVVSVILFLAISAAVAVTLILTITLTSAGGVDTRSGVTSDTTSSYINACHHLRSGFC